MAPHSGGAVGLRFDAAYWRIQSSHSRKERRWTRCLVSLGGS